MDPIRQKMALYWMVGSLSGATWSHVKYVFIVSIVMMAVILLFARGTGYSPSGR